MYKVTETVSTAPIIGSAASYRFEALLWGSNAIIEEVTFFVLEVHQYGKKGGNRPTLRWRSINSYLSFKSLLYGATFPPTHLVDFIRRGEHRGGAGFSQFYPDIPSLLGARVCVCFFYYLKKIFLLFSLSLSLSTITILPYSFLFLYLSVYVRVRAYVCECVSTLEITLIES
jgi:hypothetical protein